MEAARAGDQRALAQLLEQSWSWTYRLALRVLRSPDRAQDVAQDACLAVLRGLPRLRDAGAYRGWLARTTLRLCTQQQSRPDVELDANLPSNDGADLEGALDLTAAVELLSQTLRVPVLLFYGLDLTTAEIAEALEIPDGTVRWRLAEARRKLRGTLEPTCAAPLEKTS